MNLLAIETSSTACSVAIKVADKIYAVHFDAPRQQTKLLFPTIDKLLNEAKISLKEIDAIAVGNGPGSFTGVRIAISAVQGLAFGNDTPVILISSLAATAQTAFDKHGWRDLYVAIDARVNEIYCGRFHIDEKGLARLVGEEEVIAPEKISLPSEEQWQGIGNGWQIYKELFPFIPENIDSEVVPTAESVLKLAEEKFANKQWVQATEALPNYLRHKVAEKQKT